MRFEFHPDALTEYQDATDYYAHCQDGLEQRFMESIENGILQILDGPEQWRVFEEGVRRYLTHVFPYAILYSIEPDYILIIAVMHCSREPGYWRIRVAKGPN